MNNFRTLSESRSFLSLWLLLLLLSTFIPICDAGSVSERADVGTATNHHLNHSSSTDEPGLKSSHTDNTVHHCCTDLNASANLLPVALSASAMQDLSAERLDFESHITIPYRAVRLARSTDFQYIAAGRVLYLVTQRLRV